MVYIEEFIIVLTFRHKLIGFDLSDVRVPEKMYSVRPFIIRSTIDQAQSNDERLLPKQEYLLRAFVPADARIDSKPVERPNS